MNYWKIIESLCGNIANGIKILFHKESLYFVTTQNIKLMGQIPMVDYIIVKAMNAMKINNS